MGRLIKATAADTLPVNFQAFERYARSGKIHLPIPEDTTPPEEKARHEAETILRTARAEAQEIRAEARRTGYEQGHQEGMSEAISMVTPLVQRLEDDIASVKTETNQFLESLEPELLKLCMETVEKVIRHEARTGPEVVTRIIKSCLRRVKESHEVRVRVSPTEVAAVRAQRDELLASAEGISAISIIDDRRISAGGCVIETATGDLDATVETQLGRIEQRLTETLENDPNKT